jgi:hypothetical protein
MFLVHGSRKPILELLGKLKSRQPTSALDSLLRVSDYPSSDLGNRHNTE